MLRIALIAVEIITALPRNIFSETQDQVSCREAPLESPDTSSRIQLYRMGVYRKLFYFYIEKLEHVHKQS